MSRGPVRYVPAGFESDEEDDDGFSKVLSVKKTCENLRITVVPDITATAGLNGQPFDGSLEPELRDWFEQLKAIWFNYKRGPTLIQKLHSFFGTCSNPYVYGLKLYANCSSANSAKTNTLAFAILDELHNWKVANGSDASHYVDDNIKMVAFNFVRKQGQPSLYQMVVKTFDMLASRNLFVAKIKELIDEHSYKEACQWARELQLYNEFTIFDMVFPLILQDKTNIAEEYLNKAKHLQRPLIELLDSLLDKSSSIQNRCGEYIGKYDYKDVHLNKMQSKPLTKLITRLVKNYRLDSSVMPNVLKMKSYGALQFLLHKNYQERSLNKDSWQEMVKETVPQTESAFDLQMELIFNCSCNRDNAEAVYWADYFNIPHSKLPPLVKEYIRQSKNGSNSSGNNSPSHRYDDNNTMPTVDYHRLSLPESNVVLIDEPVSYRRMLQYLARQSMVAFDAEWKPTFCSTNDLALIQLATREYVYLIDVMVLDISLDEWSLLGRDVFNNNEILKLAFSPSSDLAMFQKTIPGFNLSTLTRTSYLDLQEFWLKLNTMHVFQFPYDGDRSASSLSALVQLCLNKKLDKSNQFSNWEKRPLRKDQIHYAALDAFCLIEIHDIIAGQFSNSGEDFSEIITNFLTEKKSKKMNAAARSAPMVPCTWTGGGGGCIDLTTESGAAASTNGSANSAAAASSSRSQPRSSTHNFNQQSSSNWNSPPPKKPKFVCDKMLHNLPDMLKQFGFDVIYLKTSLSHCFVMAQRENRIVLTMADVNQQDLRSGLCYRLRTRDPNKQLHSVLTYFTPHNICDNCLCDEFLMASQRDLREMIDIQMGPTVLPFCLDEVNPERAMKPWKWSHITNYHKQVLATSRNKPINAHAFPSPLEFHRYFICENCGTCYNDESSGRTKSATQLKSRRRR